MSLPRCERYEDSGVQWLGTIPSHWKITRLKSCCAVLPSNVDKKSVEEEQPIRLCNYTDVYYNDEITRDMDLMVATASDQQIHKFTLCANDVVITKDSETADDIARSAFVPNDLPGVVCGYHLAVLRPRPQVDGRYVKWLFDSAYLRACCEVRATGLTRVGLSQYDLDNLEIPMPPAEEQADISDYLGREVSKTNGLIQEQRRLIELLKEKRQAVISHSVTKGLNPEAPMRDSGLKWFGEVPRHWNLSKIKHEVSHVVDCLHSTPTYEGDLVYPAIRTADLEPGKLLLDQALKVSEEVYRERVQRLEPQCGDILYSREGERFGIAALVPPDTRLCLGQRMMMFRPSRGASPSFIMWLLNSPAVYQQVVESVTGPTAPHVNISDVINFSIAMPPPDEQRAIASHIDHVTGEIDHLIAAGRHGIELLQERRSALISAAVTGKIDVRQAVLEPVA